MSFMDRIKIDRMSTILKPASVNIADTICEIANELSADLIVIGTYSRSAITWALMGSVTEGILRNSDRDVLAIPPVQYGAVS